VHDLRQDFCSDGAACWQGGAENAGRENDGREIDGPMRRA